MKVYSWTGDHPNFGDDLNHFLWAHVMPEVVADPDDGALLIGVGTVLSHRLPAATPRVVIGSGVGYSAAPLDVSSSDWRIYAVRGPSTARLLGLDPDRAVIDPAVLLPTIADWSASAHGDAIFVPHWTTARNQDWQAASTSAGLRYVDPRQEPRTVIRAIAGAKLVVAESMHGAIIADAFRVPWVPVIGTHRSMFKWNDWCESLAMTYKPVLVGPQAHIQGRFAPVQTYTGQPAPLPASKTARKRWNPAQMVERCIGHLPSSVRRSLIARDLAAAYRSPARMSGDRILADRLALLGTRVETLREDYAAGRIVAPSRLPSA